MSYSGGLGLGLYACRDREIRKDDGLLRLAFHAHPQKFSLTRFQRRVTIRKSKAKFKMFVQFKMLTKASCPYCLGTHLKRSPGRRLDNHLRPFRLWPYRCNNCHARFWKRFDPVELYRTPSGSRETLVSRENC